MAIWIAGWAIAALGTIIIGQQAERNRRQRSQERREAEEAMKRNKQIQDNIDRMRRQLQEQEEREERQRERERERQREIRRRTQQVQRQRQRLREIQQHQRQLQRQRRRQAQRLKELARKQEEENRRAETMRKTFYSLQLNKLKSSKFIAYVKQCKASFTDRIQKNYNEIHIGFIGEISAGKSSLLNSLLSLNLQTGVGQTTQKLDIVAQSTDGKIKIWDCPGDNDQFSIYDPSTLKFFNSLDLVYILYPVSLKRVKDIIHALWEIVPQKTILIRTKCDQFESGNNIRSLSEELAVDKQTLRTWGINLPILSSSSKKSENFGNNRIIKQSLKTGKHPLKL